MSHNRTTSPNIKSQLKHTEWIQSPQNIMKINRRIPLKSESTL